LELDDFRRHLESALNGVLRDGLVFESVALSRNPRGGQLCEVKVCRGAKHKIGHFVAKDLTPAAIRAVASAASAYFAAFFKS
jgi:hypothetical protein